MSYNWEHKDWPNFRYNLKGQEDLLFEFTESVGHVNGLLKGLPENLQSEAIIDLMVSEAIKTSEIEGEFLSRKDVMSSIRNNLGLSESITPVHDKRAEGAAELMLAVRKYFADDLNVETLFDWHTRLMLGIYKISLK